MHNDPATGLPPEGAARLTDWGLIRVSGPDARSFLHGQLTQDVLQLSPGRAALAGYCSPKGRLLATFVAWIDRGDDVLLACSADVLPATLKRLSMFVMRARCKLADASHELETWGVAGPASLRALGLAAEQPAWHVAPAGGATAITLPPALVAGQDCPRALLLVAPGAAEPQGLAPLPLPAWQALEACSGVVRVVAATSDQFVPQMVNFEQVGGVNFKKGCYPGQEVVARSQYRGTTKRRAFLMQADAPMTPGQEIFSANDPEQPAGLVALAGTLSAHDHVALIEAKLAAVEAGALHVGRADGPLLRPAPLPYELVEDVT